MYLGTQITGALYLFIPYITRDYQIYVYTGIVILFLPLNFFIKSTLKRYQAEIQSYASPTINEYQRTKTTPTNLNLN